MARTDVHGITIDRLGRRTIDKAHRGERIFARLGAVSQEDAEVHPSMETATSRMCGTFVVKITDTKFHRLVRL
jgi:hypothetical protein